MLLLIDIGNTNITIGFYDKGIKNVWRLNTIPDSRDADEYFYLLKGFVVHNKIKEPEGAVICSVVPQVTPLFIKAFRKIFGFEPLNVTYKLKTGLKFCIRKPQELGADRIANAVAAHNLYKGHLIVIDFGTATTFDAVSADGDYLGGAIAPGVLVAAEALVQKAARLNPVEIVVPRSAIGKNTVASMQSGILFGYVGLTEGLIARFHDELGPAKVIATGGLANLIAAETKKIDLVDPYLTLDGLRLIYELNADRSEKR